MKAKNIFTALALAMLLSSACATLEITNGKGYALPVTLNVTRQGDNVATRASFDNETKKLSFSAGDLLFVNGYHSGAGYFAGALAWQSGGTFSGTILTKNEYTGTTDDLFSLCSFIKAILLPDGYENYDLFWVTDMDSCEANVECEYSPHFASSKVEAIEQLSFESASSYSNGFALSPQNAIINFTINGLTPNTEVNLSFGEGVYNAYGSTTTNGAGTATFAVGVNCGAASIGSLGLRVNDKGIHLGLEGNNALLQAGHIYNITRSASYSATGHTLSTSIVGDVVGTDGKAYSKNDRDYLPTGVTAAGVVAYKNGNNGLVIALADKGQMNWETAMGASGAVAHTPAVTGYAWKLPSKTEFETMFAANGGNSSNCSGLDAIITAAGGSGLEPKQPEPDPWEEPNPQGPEPFEVNYWTSTVSVYTSGFPDSFSITDQGQFWGNGMASFVYKVRSCFAF